MCLNCFVTYVVDPFTPQAYGTSLKLGVPSLRYSSGGIAYGLLRDDLLSMCAASPHGASRLTPR